jgi:hypothetical protein
MIEMILILLVVLWLLGFISIPGLASINFPLFVINGETISLFDLLIFLLVVWTIGILPSPFREIASVLLILWVLAVLNILAFAGLSSLILIAIIVGLIASLFNRPRVA